MINISKSYHCIRYCFCGLLMLLCFCTGAQTNLLMEAQDLSNSKQFDKAAPLIDQTVLHPETKTDPASWHIRSYVYLQLYKQTASAMQRITLLDTALRSVQQSIALDKEDSYKENNLSFIRGIATGYYKLSSSLFQDSLNAALSEEAYNRYKRTTYLINPGFEFKEKDIEYYKAVGSHFCELYMKNNFNQKYGEISKGALLRVLELDPKNITANINLGVLYYNQGAMLMRLSDYDMDLTQLDVVQENAKKIFKQSLPFMIKVYELDPKNKNALIGLEGIYSALMDEEKANEFKRKQEALGIQK